MNLSDPVTNLPGVGESFRKKLAKLDIITIQDLLDHFPFRYLDYQKTTPIANLVPNEPVCIKATLTKFSSVRIRGNRSLQKAVITDPSGSLSLIWFNQPYLKDSLRLNEEYFFTGTIDSYQNKLVLNSPDFEPVKQEQLHTNRIIPVYPLTAGVTQKWLRHKTHLALTSSIIPEIYNPPTKFLSLKEAYHHIHFPESQKILSAARQRLAFDDLLAIHLKSHLTKLDWQTHSATPINLNHKLHQQLIDSLSFSLTPDQGKVIDQIFTDLTQNHPMNRLLQGDVGSGKTIVALAATLQVLNHGQSVVILAPTQVLAQQHHQTFTKILKAFKMPVLLTTATTKSALSTTKPTLHIGTHALLHQKDLLKLNLGLLIIDEQHRFGVLQRSHFLTQKKLPHCLTMSATPIPRTIALSLYGHLDISNIITLPKNRKPIKTWFVPETKRPHAYDWLKKELTKGKQAFVVCPLIDQSESDTLKNVAAATKLFGLLQRDFSHFKVALLHGRMKPTDKEQTLKDFKAQKYHLLVTTPVIEVGIDIPNASIILVEGSERFGLASLHQLRGRVGRGDTQSYCLLFASNNEPATIKRLKILEKHNHGLNIARLDLRLRGAGELFGTSQSGHLDTQFKEFWDQTLNSQAKSHALKLITNHDKAQKILRKLNPQLAKTTSPN